MGIIVEAARNRIDALRHKKESLLPPEIARRSHIVTKFGGDNMATAETIIKSADILEMDPRRLLVVVSAPGKRFKGDEKVTWILEDCGKLPVGHKFDERYEGVRSRYMDIANGLFKGDEQSLQEVNGWLNEAKEGILEQKENITAIEQKTRYLQEQKAIGYSASRGEWLMAKIFAKYLNTRFPDASFMDATKVIRVKNGQIADKTYDLVGEKFANLTNVTVVPGFYGIGEDGDIATLGRGASDTTAAALARGTNAQTLEIFKELSGVYSADPKKIPYARQIPEITYDEMAEVAFREATPLHREAVRIASDAGIPINVKSFSEPKKEGTLIVSERKIPRRERVTVVTGKDGFAAVIVTKDGMNTEVGALSKILGVFTEHKIPIDHNPTSTNSSTTIFDKRELENMDEDVVTEIIDSIENAVNPESIDPIQDVGVLSVVGNGMKGRNAKVNYRVFRILDKNGIDVLAQSSTPKGNNLVIVVPEDQLDLAVHAIHDRYAFKRGSKSRKYSMLARR